MLYEIDGSGLTSKRCPGEWFNGLSVPFIVHAHVRKRPYVLVRKDRTGVSPACMLCLRKSRDASSGCVARERRAICISGYVVHSDAPDASGRPVSRIVIDDQRRVRTHMHSFLDVHTSITSPFGALLDPGCSN